MEKTVRQYSNLKQKVVYLAAPKQLLSSDEYDRAFTFLLFQSKGVVNPRWMFSSNQDWLENYEERLKIADAMVIVSNRGMVGKGVYLEYNYFRDRFCKVYHYIEREDERYTEISLRYDKSLEEIKRIEIVDDEDWVNYALIK